MRFLLPLFSLLFFAGCIGVNTEIPETSPVPHAPFLKSKSLLKEEKPYYYYIGQKMILDIFCDAQNPKTVSEWKKAKDADLAINAGYFTKEMNPAGYLKTPKFIWDAPAYEDFWGITTEGEGMFGKTKNIDANDFALLLTSFPLLVSEEKAVFTKETGKQARRTILGKRDGYLVFIIFDAPITLYEAAKFLQKEKFEIALNLDGGPSTGFSSKAIEFSSAPVPCALLGKSEKKE